MKKYIDKIKGMFLDLSVIVIIAFIYGLIQLHGTRKIIGSIIALLGLIFWFIARHNLGEAWSIKPEAKFLVKNNLYKKIRHPIYLFSTIAVFGVCIMFNLWWMHSLTVALIITQFVRAQKEEKILLDEFHNKYSEYKKSTWF